LSVSVTPSCSPLFHLSVFSWISAALLSASTTHLRARTRLGDTERTTGREVAPQRGRKKAKQRERQRQRQRVIETDTERQRDEYITERDKQRKIKVDSEFLSFFICLCLSLSVFVCGFMLHCCPSLILFCFYPSPSHLSLPLS
jgi:hypothetical protein